MSVKFITSIVEVRFEREDGRHLQIFSFNQYLRLPKLVQSFYVYSRAKRLDVRSREGYQERRQTFRSVDTFYELEYTCERKSMVPTLPNFSQTSLSFCLAPSHRCQRPLCTGSQELIHTIAILNRSKLDVVLYRVHTFSNGTIENYLFFLDKVIKLYELMTKRYFSTQICVPKQLPIFFSFANQSKLYDFVRVVWNIF